MSEPQTFLEPRYALNPATGERQALDATPQSLAEAIDGANQMIRELGTFKNVLGRELITEMDRRLEWTIHLENFSVSSRSPEPPPEWDVDKLRHELTKLVDQGIISEEAAKKAVRTKVTYEPQANGLKSLRKLGPVVNEALDSCLKETDRELYARSRSVRVSVAT